jgi:hypothetical protein
VNKRFGWLLAFFALLMGFHLASQTAQAGIIYAATGGENPGSLYTLNGSTGVGTLVGALVDAGLQPYALTGLAFDPVTGILYGSTSNSSPTDRSHLVRVDPATGAITDIGAYGLFDTLSDITFTSNETLYGWHAADDHSLYTVNLATGAATIVAISDIGGGFGGGALAANAANVLYLMPDSQTNPPGTLRTVSQTTGQTTIIATLSGAPVLTDGNIMSINAMKFDESGNLLGINNLASGFSTISTTHLVRINTTTGAITDIGPSINYLDAIAIQFGAVPEPGTMLLVGAGLGSVIFRRRR